MALGLGLGLLGFGSYQAAGGGGLTGAESDGTQLLTAPFDAAGGWTAVLATLTANAALAPDGTTTAASLIEDTGTTYHRAKHNAGNFGSVGAFTFSDYLKMAGRRYALIQVGFIEVYCIYDLQTGVIVTSGNNGGNGTLTGTDIQVGANGFYKCSLSWTTANTYTEVMIATQSAGTFTSGGQNYTGDGASGLYHWRPKLTQP